jgi:hypothetical protein
MAAYTQPVRLFTAQLGQVCVTFKGGHLQFKSAPPRLRNIAAELQLQSNISFKSCGIAIAEVLPSSCRLAIADSKTSCTRMPTSALVTPCL